MKLYKKQNWIFQNGNVYYPVPKPIYSLAENPIVSTQALFWAMWNANDPSIINARKTMDESDYTKLDKNYDPTNPLGGYGINHATQQICMSLMKVCNQIVNVEIPGELKQKKEKKSKRHKDTGPAIVTPPFMHRESD